MNLIVNQRQAKKIFLTALLIFSGCLKNNSGSNLNPNPTSPAAQDKNQLQQNDLDSKKVFQQGGLPGLITLSGILVSQDLKLDTHVETISEAGFGKDGTAATLSKATLYALSPVADIIKVPLEERTLMSLGCDETFTLDFAKKRSLEIKKVMPLATDQKILMRAKTIVLCGIIKDLQVASVELEADEIILNSADFSQVGIGGTLSIASNKLFLFGSNIITTQGSVADLIFFAAPSITIKVAQQLIAEDSARLLVVSKGSSYAE